MNRLEVTTLFMQTKIKSNHLTRRQFLNRTTLAATTATIAFPYVGRVQGANDRINVACIGVGGKGDSDSSEAGKNGGNIVAICDVDQNSLDRKAKQFPKAKQYRDYRKLLDEMGKDIDAVTVSTPDHNHGIASIRAMKMGKHCFCQKPLTQTVAEARLMRQLSKEKKLATQMGNQGSAESGLRRAVEVIQSGAIGDVEEVHVWSNRPKGVFRSLRFPGAGVGARVLGECPWSTSSTVPGRFASPVGGVDRTACPCAGNCVG